jgi:choline dehydrogenase-like flavoprotein
VQLLHKWFRAATSAAVYASVEARGLDSPHGRRNRVVNFVVSQHAAMPDFLRWPIIILTLAFDCAGFLYYLGLFHRQNLPRRIAQMQLWRESPIGPFRDLMRFYDSLAALAWAETDLSDRPEETKAPAVIGKAGSKVAVVGSGPGGAITAALLAEQGLDVTLFEEGPHYQLESCTPFSSREMVQKYRNGGLTPALGHPKVAYVEGRCVGGGSEINSGLYHRTPPMILERWQNEYGLLATEHELLPHYEACEKDVSVGFSPGKLPAASLKLHEGASALGWKSQEVPRWFSYDGDVDAMGLPTGNRQSMTRTFIRRFEAANGRLAVGGKCERIRAAGDQFRLGFGPGGEDFLCEKLFVSCGAIGTPALLQRSGIKGPIGRNLQMHPTIKIVAEFNEEINSERMGVPVHQVKEFAPDFSFGCSISSYPYLALALLDHPDQLARLGKSWRRMAIYYAMIVPEARGSVRAFPGFHDPLVRFSPTGNDLHLLAVALRRLSELLFAAGACALFPSVGGLQPLKNHGDIKRLPNILPADRANLMTIHLFSTCPMGENIALCPVDSFGRMRGVPGLHVADASLLPSAPGVNPQGSTMAFVRRNALEFAGSCR